MKYITIYLNRKSSSFGEQLDEVRAVKQIKWCSLTDTDEGDIIFQALCSEEPSVNQTLVAYGIGPAKEVADLISADIAGLDKSKRVTAINLLPLSGRRAFGLVVTEDAAVEAKPDGTSARKETKRKQNKKADALPDAGTEGSPVDGN